MNIKLNQWNELIEHGNQLCRCLKLLGYDVRLKPYTMYDGRKGLSMQVLDSCGNIFTEYQSGVDTFNIMKATMTKNAARITVEC